MKTKVNKLAVVLALLVLTVAPAFAQSYQVDTNASTVKWTGKKVAGSHHGTIALKEGELEMKGNQLIGGSVVVDMTTIKDLDLTDPEWNQKLVGHLRSNDFFGVEKFPVSRLVIKKVESKGGNLYHVTGDLTIKGITKPVEFDSSILVTGNKLEATGTIPVDRTKYGIKYGSGSFFSNLGDKMIDDVFTLDFSLVAHQ
ncbi:YceI family protein [Prolixibacter denitrificans]|uniref:Lipid-binding protein n=1 Tax=Prolixibacter denitrificans TaxID=1541063 RepID=A0A2P8CHE6_9BACT|nr:YceI family protein [Prolixibacter denitrificans]PSK84391.1 polyisoprenoid-binding protein YceI [Prolixibacter denitrificans]GET20565.1 lipid-binding protein [Prolixibacter denitrificans]